MDRRAFLQLTATCPAFTLLTPDIAMAQWRPRRPLNVIVPYKAGGGADAFARALGASAADDLPVPIVIVNKPGSSGITGAMAAYRARPDGNTILLTSATSLILNSKLRDIEVDAFDSFQTIAQIGNLKAGLFVPAASPYQSLADLVEDAKARPGELRWGHTGRGSFLHVAGQGFLNANALEAGDVPYKGGAAIRAALVGEQMDFGVAGINVGAGFENEMRALAIFAPERDAIFADVPTVAESGFEYTDVSSPIVLFAPKDLDAEIVTGMQDAFKEIVAKPKFAELMLTKGNAPDFLAGEQADARLRTIETTVEPIIAEFKGG